MEKFIAFGNQTDGRDKLNKAFQFGSRLMAWSLGETELAKSLSSFSTLTSNARKIFRLFKSVNEMKTINTEFSNIIWQNNRIPHIVNLLSRIGFLFYWLFDNVVILSTVKLIKVDSKHFNKIACTAWFVGLIFGLLKNCLDLIQLMSTKAKTPEEKKANQIKLLKVVIEITNKFGDLICSANGMELPHRLTGKGFSEGLIAFAGFTSSIGGLYNHFN